MEIYQVRSSEVRRCGGVPEDRSWLGKIMDMTKSSITGQEQRMYDKLYTSDTWITAHNDLQKQRRDNGCKLEHIIASLMLWSDAMHLAQFGSASAWPVYLFFGNQSKYTQAIPDSGACHPIAFIPTVSFIDVILSSYSDLGRSATRNYSWIRI